MLRFLDPLFYSLVFLGFVAAIVLGIFEAARTWREKDGDEGDGATT